jgi:hypothetical protein
MFLGLQVHFIMFIHCMQKYMVKFFSLELKKGEDY